jgi:hypothetical protein
MRVDSRVEAQRKTTRASNTIVCIVCASMTLTPDVRPVRGSYRTLSTTLQGRSVSFPVAAAAGSVTCTLLKYEYVVQPRSHHIDGQ